ncbi:MAG: hypothetical protein ACLTTJ_14330 [Blautia sp.]
MSISEARKDSQTPFIPSILESTIATESTMAIAPRIREPMIAGRAFAVAEKYATSVIFTPANPEIPGNTAARPVMLRNAAAWHYFRC